MHIVKTTLVAVLLAASVVAGPRPMGRGRHAPAILKRMTLTESEFQSLFHEKEQSGAGYCAGNLNGLGATKQKHGRAFFRVYWDQDYKTKKMDYNYRPGPNAGDRNPDMAEVTTVLRFAPAKQPWKVKDGRPASRADMKIIGRINYMDAARLAKSRASDQKRSDKHAARKRKDWAYTFTKDLGFGLDRNDMACVMKTNGMGGEVRIRMGRARDFTWVFLYFKYEWRALSHKRAQVIARNAAAIVANKVWGTAIKQQRDPGEVGIIDAYTASRLGKTPVEDRRETRFAIGKPQYVAIVYRTDMPGARCFFHVRFKPSAAAIAKCRQILPHIKAVGRAARETVGANWTNAQLIQLEQGGAVDEMSHSSTNSRFHTKPLNGGLRVVYVQLPTTVMDDLNSFWKAPGEWEMEVSMSEYRGKTDDSIELSTEKKKVEILASPAFYTRHFKGLDPKTGAPR